MISIVSIMNNKSLITELVGPLAQAAIWGVSSGLASRLSGNKAKTDKEKRQKLKDAAIATGLGAAAGAIGSMV